MKRALQKEPVDRPPCICPGGMMNMITTELMDEVNISWPEAHLDAKMMAELAEANYKKGCFENVGVPFCMTIEAEGFGAEVTLGSKMYEPHVTGYAMNSVTEWRTIKPMNLEEGRAKVVLDAIRILKSRKLDVPIIGIGGVSTASDVIEMMLAGATAVQIGAANLTDPYVCRDIVLQLPETMKKYGISDLREITGGAH